MKRLVRLALLGLCWTGSVFAAGSVFAFANGGANGEDEDESEPQGLGLSSYVSRDNEGFTAHSLALSYFPRFQHGVALTGFRYTERRYKQDDWRGDAQELSVVHRNIEPATWEGWQLDAGWSRQGDHDLIKLDGNVSTSIGERRRLEFFASRNWVETERALESGTSFTFVGTALEQGLGSHLTLIGIAGRQEFSDGNYRNHGRARLIVQPNLDLGLTLQGRYRMFTSAEDDVGGAYFNPDRYGEVMLAFGWRYRVQGWMANLTAGIGEQEVADAPGEPTRLLEFELRAPPSNRNAFSLRAGHSRSASFQGPDYVYRYFRAEWILGF